MYDWKIKARVTKKSDLRQFTTQKGPGKVFSADLIDADGTQIQASFFNDAAEQFFPQIQENKVYLFSNGYVKLANKRFTSIKNDYCLNFDKGGDIEEVPEDVSIKNQGFDFIKI